MQSHYTTKISLMRAGSNRPAATLNGDTLERSASGKKHFLRQGIAFHQDTIGQAEQLGAKSIEVYDRDTGKIYSTSLDTFLRRGWRFDWGHGPQMGLAFSHWQIKGEPHQPALFAEAAT